jgi:hypothetical protein
VVDTRDEPAQRTDDAPHVELRSDKQRRQPPQNVEPLSGTTHKGGERRAPQALVAGMVAIPIVTSVIGVWQELLSSQDE